MSFPDPAVVAILGAGAMGSALATPLRARGHEVRLWGTWLDDQLLDVLERGERHPRTAEPLAPGTQLFRSTELSDALDGADVAFLAVASAGVLPVVRLAAAPLSAIGTLGLTSKGLSRAEDGTIGVLPAAIAAAFDELAMRAPTVVAIGGPCKANEVAAGRPTASAYGCSDLSTALAVATLAQTDGYRIEVLRDDVGLEICAALKNVFAIALGYSDGLSQRTGEPWHDLRSAIFAQAVREIATIAAASGGEAVTAFGLPGAGDLEVTGLSGRNKVFGARIGSGESARSALDAMRADEQTVEGVPAAALAVELAGQLFDDARERLPLLHAVDAIIRDAIDPLAALVAAALPPRISG